MISLSEAPDLTSGPSRSLCKEEEEGLDSVYTAFNFSHEFRFHVKTHTHI